MPASGVPPAAVGSPFPLGATLDDEGVNLAVFSRHGTRVLVCLYDPEDPGREIARHELAARTDQVHHGHLSGVRAGALYGLRVEGPFDPRRGHLFNPNKLLMDPYARALVGKVDWDGPVFGYERPTAEPLVLDQRDSAAAVPRSVVLADDFAWQGDRRPATPWSDTVIYEAHVSGLTRRHPDVLEPLRGTYAGLGHPAVVDHLRRLGVTAVELLPVHHHVDEEALVRRGTVNHWGYNTLGYFAVEPRWAGAADPGGCVREFKGMVKALHRAGLEVILDVVYNHTAEGGAGGPTFSFRGLDNATYYHLDPADPARFLDFAGTGNSLNLGALYPMQMVMDSLRYWAVQMHVDGFRFDLAPELTRAWPDYQFRSWSGFLQAVHQDPVLGRLKLIAEPWDFGGDGYRLGQFPSLWSEWNDRFRDTSRRFWWGDAGARPELERRLLGSPDVFREGGRPPHASINFVTCHDGFTLEDLVSYQRKHNEANGEQNRDGADENHSGNHGVEGPTEDAEVLRARERHKRNLLATLLLARGVPMLLMGDELGRTQRGNNNAYCQDNELSWVDWSSGRGARLLAFVVALSELRRRARSLLEDRWPGEPGAVEPRWLELESADDGPARAPDAFALAMVRAGAALIVVVNGSPQPRALTVPGDVARWTVAIDTAEEQAGRPLAAGDRLMLAARSLLVLEQA
jgi:isoamylase